MDKQGSVGEHHFSLAVGKSQDGGIYGSVVFCNFKDVCSIYKFIPEKIFEGLLAYYELGEEHFPLQQHMKALIQFYVGRGGRITTFRIGGWKRKKVINWRTLGWWKDGNLFPTQMDPLLSFEIHCGCVCPSRWWPGTWPPFPQCFWCVISSARSWLCHCLNGWHLTVLSQILCILMITVILDDASLELYRP